MYPKTNYFKIKNGIKKKIKEAKIKEAVAKKLGRVCAFQTEEYKEYQREYKKKRRAMGFKQPTYGTAEYRQQYRKLYHAYHRDRVFELLGGAVCVECGCTVRENLELNHIQGGGSKDMKRLKRRKIVGAIKLKYIAEHPEELSKYNVLCRVCNAHHYLRDIKQVPGGKYEIKFTPTPLTSTPDVLN